MWERFLNKVVKVTYNDTPNSVAIITGKLLEETESNIIILHEGVEVGISNSKIVKVVDYSFMDYIKCNKCGFFNWFKKSQPIKVCKQCGAILKGDDNAVGSTLQQN